MAHIHHFRTLEQVQRRSLQEVRSDRHAAANFAAFCGGRQQREAVGLHEMERCCGKRGVVLIHNDPQLEGHLGRIYDRNPLLRRLPAQFQMYLANPNGAANAFYDPLYGLSASYVLDILCPVSDDGFRSETQAVRSTLSDYLELLRFQCSKHPTPFGASPYNLDLLLELTRMPYSDLERNVLAFLPQPLSGQLMGRLSQSGSQQKAFHAVRAFAQAMNKCLWTPRGFAGHTKLSIIQAVREKCLISIYVPGSRSEILDYLAVELQALNDQNAPYLLVTSGITLPNSPRFQSLFLQEHSAMNYATGILAEDLSSAVQTDASDRTQAALFGQLQELFVFACSSTLAAAPFSAGIGQYYRQVTERHMDKHREPFRIFSSHGHGMAQREVQQAVVNPEELTRLGDGCLLYGKNHPIPILIQHFTL